MRVYVTLEYIYYTVILRVNKMRSIKNIIYKALVLIQTIVRYAGASLPRGLLIRNDLNLILETLLDQSACLLVKTNC